MNRIINSVADNDLYNFHMGDFFFHRYKGAPVSYTYKNRNPSIDLSPIVPALREQVEMMAELRLTSSEAEWMLKNTKCSEEYLEYLTKTQVFDPKALDIRGSNVLQIQYSGETQSAIFWEVALMATISELHFAHVYQDRYAEVLQSGEDWIQGQINWLHENGHPALNILEMGGRRRFSYDHQRKALDLFWNGAGQFFKGTSNVHLGMELDIPVFGTMAHLLFMFMQTVHPVHRSQKEALNEWYQHFGGSLGVALTDTLGNEKWERDFDKGFSILYPWERHDSGCPYEWAEKRIESALDKGLDTAQRGLLFSDGLSLEKANDLTAKFSEATQVGVGIGTYITNTMGIEGHKPIPQVAKMTWANGMPTCKLSAEPGKGQCEDPTFHEWVKHVAARY
jgi:nicotinate phosphoribosyltransferase